MTADEDVESMTDVVTERILTNEELFAVAQIMTDIRLQVGYLRQTKQKKQRIDNDTGKKVTSRTRTREKCSIEPCIYILQLLNDEKEKLFNW